MHCCGAVLRRGWEKPVRRIVRPARQSPDGRDASGRPDGVSNRRDVIRPHLHDLPLDRLVSILSGADFTSTVAVEEIGLPSLVFADGPHGVRRQPSGADHIGLGSSLPATLFPTASLLGATWDEGLLEEVGAALGREARALGVDVLLGPGLNLKRHPACGRNFEYLSEDPVVSGLLAAALTRGVQSEGVAACLKHYVANNQETCRMVVDVIVDERTLRELYLRSFEIAVERGDPWAVMTSYNLVGGDYVSDSHRLVDGVLRSEWGFDGLIVTDWGGMNDRVAAVRAGVDLEMPSSSGAHDLDVMSAVERGELDREAIVDRATTVVRLADRISSTRERIVEPTSNHRHGADEVAHDRLARRVAAAGTVLLSNDGTLPLDPPLSIALLGALAEEPRVQGAGSSQVVPTRVETIRRALERRCSGDLTWAPVYDAMTGRSTPTQIDEATRLASEADIALVVVGLPASSESEGIDRQHLSLPHVHDELVTAVCAANRRTVVVLQNGAPVLMPWADRPAAILETHLGGQAGPIATVDVLVGDAEPGGRLAESYAATPDFPSAANFAGDRRQVQYREGPYVGYRFHTSAGVPAQFAFGHGLSYTRFEWAPASVERDGPDVTVRVDVTNVGNRRGSEVVQLYVRTPNSVVDRPDRELQAFAKLHLDSGESQTAVLHLDRQSFRHFDVATDSWVVEAGRRELLVAAASNDVRERIDIDFAGDTNVSPWSGPESPGFVADDARFAEMLGGPIPTPRPVLPFTLNTIVDELDATALGRATQRALLKVAEREMTAVIGPEPDPQVRALSERMLREAPLRFLVAMSDGRSSLGALDGLANALSALRLSKRTSGRDQGNGTERVT